MSERDIKHLKPRRGHYKQGYFDNHDPKKYVGKYPIIYRSSLEYKFMWWCENNHHVVNWASEPFSIKYYTPDGVEHNYWIDFIVTLTNGENWLIEVKPLSQVPVNEAQVNLNPTMRKNALKWQTTIAWCKNQETPTKFKIITENFFTGGK